MERTRQSSRKRQKLLDREQNMDRLSGLPDGVVCHILSFLPTKLSVATSVLGRRWRYLWAHVPNLDFGSGYLCRELSVLDIINRVMSLYKVESMNSFCLSYVGDDDNRSKFQLETCINSAIARNVKQLHLSLLDRAILPRYIFTCKSLVDLTLRFCGEIPTTGSVYLPALERLHLNLVSCESDESLVNLLSGCPVLEELIIRYSNLVCCDISSPTIKRLMFKSNLNSLGHNEDYKVKIETPALRFLQLQNSIPEDVSAGTLASLIEAEIILDDLTITGGGGVLHCPSVLKFIGGLCNVQCLKLSSGPFKVPDSAFSALTTKFHNLTKLELGADWRFLSHFLGYADNLEVLTIREVNIDLKRWVEPLQVPKCLLSHLRSVRIDRMGCRQHEFNMVKYLLRNAQVLKRLEIYSQHHGTDFKAKFDALKRISSFERGSKTCKLVFH